MNFNSPKYQIYALLTISVIISLSLNVIRSNPISMIAQDLKKIDSIDELANSNEPSGIVEIDIDIAKDLYERGTLFIDARAEENFNDGHIPGAICSDEFDELIDKIYSFDNLEKAFVVYCSDDDCGSSEELSYQLYDQGFESIYLFKGGWKQWIENNLPAKYY